MRFEYGPELLAYMEKTGKRNISVEVASADHSDFDVTELYYRVIDDKTAAFLVKNRRFRAVETAVGKVLLPTYYLEYAPVVTFHRKKYWIFHRLTAEGISL